VPRDGSDRIRSVATLTQTPYWFDSDPDGSIYIDQTNRPAEIYRYVPVSGAVERISLPSTFTAAGVSVAVLPLRDAFLAGGECNEMSLTPRL